MKNTLIFFSIFAITVIVIYYSYKIRDSNIKKNEAFTTGLITNYRRSNKGGSTIDYEYTIGNKKFKDSKGYGNIIDRYSNILIGKSFPVIYNSNKLNSNNILLTRDDFKQYNLTFPDSLSWVMHCFEKNK